MAPSFNSKFGSMIPSWISPLGRTGWKDEIIPYGPFLNDDADLGGPELIYESSQISVVFYGMLQTYLTLILLLFIFPLIVVKVVVNLLSQ